MGWIQRTVSRNKSKVENQKMMKIEKADKSSFAGTTADSESQPIDFRQPAYCQTQCCVQPYVHTTRVKKNDGG